MDGFHQKLECLFFLLSTCTEELICFPKIIALLPNSPLGCEKAPFSSKQIPYLEYLYFLISAFLVNLTAPNNFLG